MPLPKHIQTKNAPKQATKPKLQQRQTQTTPATKQTNTQNNKPTNTNPHSIN